MPRPRLSCGYERSSNGVSALVLDIDKGDVVYKNNTLYDDAFGDRYDIDGGVLRSDIPEKRHAPQKMLLEAHELVFEKMPDDIIGDILVYKEDDMQHALGITRNLSLGLDGMSPQKSLVENLGRYFSRETTHIWEDRTTQKEVDYLNEQLEKHGGMVALTANPAELRFPAAQILKWKNESPEEYKATDLIQPLSAFGTSVLAGRVAPVDTGDGWGTNMNTMNINNPGWNMLITDLIDMALYNKLCGMTHYDTRIGPIAEYFVKRFGANPDAYVLAGTGDNPAYLLGFFLSAGTSWTLNGELPEVVGSNGEDNVFGCKPGGTMSLVCFTNGGRLHKQFGQTYKCSDWNQYHEMGARAEPAKHLMLPYLLDESVPRRKAGIVRDGFDESDPSINIRALCDSQVLAARLHSQHMKIPDTILLVAGGGKNPLIRQAVADAFQRKVKTLAASEYAAVLGNAMAGAADVLGISYAEAVRRYAKELPDSLTEPNRQNVSLYEQSLKRYAALEKANA